MGTFGPQLPRPVVGPQGGVAAPPGLSLVPQNGASKYIDAINQFVQNYRAARQSEEDRYAKKVERDIQNMMLGLPVDVKKVAQNMKKAGMEIDLEGPSREELMAERARALAQVTNPAAPVPINGTGLPSGLTQGDMVPPVPPPQQAPSFGQKLGQFLGMSAPKLDPNSPGLQWLQRLQQQGQNARQLSEMESQNKLMRVQILQKAMQGDDKAMMLARAIGDVPKLENFEMIYDMGLKAGMSPEQISEFILKVHASPLTNAALDYEAQMAKYSQDEKWKMFEKKLSLLETYPYAGQMADMAVAAYSAGDRGSYNELMRLISKTPSKYQLDWEDRSQNRALRAREIANSEARLAWDKDIGGKRLDFAKLQEANRLAAQEIKDYMSLMSQKDAPQNQKEAAQLALVDTLNNRAIKNGSGTRFTIEDTKDWWSIFPGGDPFHVKQISTPPGAQPGKIEAPGGAPAQNYFVGTPVKPGSALEPSGPAPGTKSPQMSIEAPPVLPPNPGVAQLLTGGAPKNLAGKPLTPEQERMLRETILSIGGPPSDPRYGSSYRYFSPEMLALFDAYYNSPAFRQLP